MILKTCMTSRDASVDEVVVLAELQTLNELWTYAGIVGSIKLFRLVIRKEE